MDHLGSIFLFVAVVWIIIFIVALGVTIVDIAYRSELADIEIPCIITHMDVDNGNHVMTVVGMDRNFSKTIHVSDKVYARYTEGESCIVIQGGYNSPISGDIFTYRFKED